MLAIASRETTTMWTASDRIVRNFPNPRSSSSTATGPETCTMCSISSLRFDTDRRAQRHELGLGGALASRDNDAEHEHKHEHEHKEHKYYSIDPCRRLDRRVVRSLLLLGHVGVFWDRSGVGVDPSEQRPVAGSDLQASLYRPGIVFLSLVPCYVTRHGGAGAWVPS
mmetsp:Transcript_29082/g.68361  ORF Transcript_29082/g.68361 Transcript_29082/m.68361 type:complete len:167 (+) Transcript_29082:251-751(+)